MNSKWATYKKLELIPDWVPEPRSFGRHRRLFERISNLSRVATGLFSLWMENCWEHVLDEFLSAPHPRIHLKHDASGNPYWYVYDPISRESAHFVSEHEVRVWLEGRYYRRSEETRRDRFSDL